MSATVRKHAIVARSGVYQYHRTEVPRLIPDSEIPKEYESRMIFNVYRPAAVIADAAPRFVNLPITNEHKPYKITTDNFRENGLGLTGDSASVEKLSGSNEIGIYTSLNIADSEALEAYDQGVREVSPSYEGAFRWAPGKTEDGIEYQIIMDSMSEIDSLAMTKRGRGGREVAIKDSKNLWKLFLEFIGSAPVQDHDIEFAELMNEAVRNRATWSDEEMRQSVDKMHDLVKTLPVGEKRDILDRLIGDFYNAKTVFPTDDEAQKAASMIIELFTEIDPDAPSGEGKEMEDDMKLFAKAKAKDAEPEEMKKPSPEPGAESTGTPPAKGEQPPAENQVGMTIHDVPEKASDMGDDHVAFLLEQVVQLLKQAEAEEQGSEEEEAEAEQLAEEAIAEEGQAGDEDMKEELESEQKTKAKSQDSIYRSPITSAKSGPTAQSFVDAWFAKKGRK